MTSATNWRVINRCVVGILVWRAFGAQNGKFSYELKSWVRRGLEVVFLCGKGFYLCALFCWRIAVRGVIDIQWVYDTKSSAYVSVLNACSLQIQSLVSWYLHVLLRLDLCKSSLWFLAAIMCSQCFFSANLPSFALKAWSQQIQCMSDFLLQSCVF